VDITAGARAQVRHCDVVQSYVAQKGASASEMQRNNFVDVPSWEVGLEGCRQAAVADFGLPDVWRLRGGGAERFACQLRNVGNRYKRCTEEQIQSTAKG
jgi:hypothetical protein